jgi:hypothetical protein
MTTSVAASEQSTAMAHPPAPPSWYPRREDGATPQPGDLLLLDRIMRRIRDISGAHVVHFVHPSPEKDLLRRAAMAEWKAQRDAYIAAAIDAAWQVWAGENAHAAPTPELEAMARGHLRATHDAALRAQFEAAVPPPERSREGYIGVHSLEWLGEELNCWGAIARVDVKRPVEGAIRLEAAVAVAPLSGGA